MGDGAATTTGTPPDAVASYVDGSGTRPAWPT
jgi:hypothetical protein